MSKVIKLCVLSASIATCMPSYAFDWGVSANVTIVEATYMPQQVVFKINNNAGTCAAGSWLTWNGQGPDTATQQANVKAVFALLLSAQISGGLVSAYGNNSGCTVSYIHLGNG